MRLWDNARPERHNFPPREWYPVKKKYRIAAEYIRFETPGIIKMPDIFGDLVDERVHGRLNFSLQIKPLASWRLKLRRGGCIQTIQRPHQRKNNLPPWSISLHRGSHRRSGSCGFQQGV